MAQALLLLERTRSLSSELSCNGWPTHLIPSHSLCLAGKHLAVVLGFLLQWLANLILLHRFLIGFGLETTFIASPECYRKAFPSKIGVMSGVDTAQRMASVFLSYQLLPIIADSKDGSLDEGTNFALGICFALSLVSTYASIAVAAGFFVEDRNLRASLEGDSDESVIKRTFGSLAKAATPSLPSGFARYKLPLSVYLIVVAIKSTGYYFNTFALYAVFVYTGRFGMPQAQASFATGLTPLLAVPIAPTIGKTFDRYGSRGKIGIGLTSGGLFGIVLLLITDSHVAVWIATVLLSAMTAGLFVCVPTIPMITGPARTGLGYGLYCVLGNIIDGFNAFIAGVLIGAGENGDLYFILYSCGFIALGLCCWVLVYFLEKDMSFLERPSSKIVNTRLEDLVSASVCGMLHEEGGTGEPNGTVKAAEAHSTSVKPECAEEDNNEPSSSSEVRTQKREPEVLSCYLGSVVTVEEREAATESEPLPVDSVSPKASLERQV